MTPHTILRPQLRAAFSRRSSSNLSRLLIRRATNHPRQGGTENNDRRSGPADPVANPDWNFFHS
jgi:hypothetical protein